MSFSDKDYYQILGISPDASSKEIKECYKKLMMENHPDRFKGLKAKYQAEGDEVLLEVLEEKIRQADEACKFINEAYEALSDPELRKAYDEETYEPKVPVPEIVVKPTKLSFGTLNEGQRKSESFTIENKGGPAVAVEIYWEDDPDWGELVIEPDPEETFPIEVTVKVDTTGIPSGSKNQKIFIKVNGTSHTVDVLLSVLIVYRPTRTVTSTMSPVSPAPTPMAPSVPAKAPNRAILIGLVMLFPVLFGWFVWEVTAEERAFRKQLQMVEPGVSISYIGPGGEGECETSRSSCKYEMYRLLNNSPHEYYDIPSRGCLQHPPGDSSFGWDIILEPYEKQIVYCQTEMWTHGEWQKTKSYIVVSGCYDCGEEIKRFEFPLSEN